MSQMNLAVFMLRGEAGFKKDERKAYLLLRKAAKDPRSTLGGHCSFWLGQCLLNGWGTFRDPAKALPLFEAARAQGLSRVDDSLLKSVRFATAL